MSHNLQVAETVFVLAQIPCSKPIFNVLAAVPSNWWGTNKFRGSRPAFQKRNGKKNNGVMY